MTKEKILKRIISTNLFQSAEWFYNNKLSTFSSSSLDQPPTEESRSLSSLWRQKFTGSARDMTFNLFPMLVKNL